VLGHLGDTTTTPWVHLHTANVLPEGVLEECWLNRAAPLNNAHHFDRVLIFQEHFVSLAGDALLKCTHIPFVPLRENRLGHEEVRQRIRENIHLEFDWFPHRCIIARVLFLRLDYYKCASLNDLRFLSHLRAVRAVELNEVQRSLRWEEDLDGFNAASYEFAFFNLGVLEPGHETIARKLLKLTAEEV